MKCPQKHTLYQPKDDEWACPQCGADSESFYIESTDGTDDCVLLHDTDFICCINCDYDTSGKAFANYLKKKHSLVKCPHCHGTGLVKSSGEVPDERPKA